VLRDEGARGELLDEDPRPAGDAATAQDRGGGAALAIERPVSFRVPLTEDEHRMLRELAEREGVTATTLVRGWIRREHAAGRANTKKGGRR
jgi:hypothetical protein